jgi:rod shape-determining protein MreC
VVAIPSFWDERKLLVFVALIIVAAAVMLLELDAVRHGRQSLIDQLVSAVYVPVESAIAHAASAVAGETHDLASAGSLAAQNKALEDKVHALAASNERLRSSAVENQELRKMLAMRQSLRRDAIAADIVGFVPEAARREVTIDKGSRDGVKRDAVVVDGDGLVGHVTDVGAREAHVLLVIDPTSAVPAFLEDTRSWGIVTGTWLHAKMKYIDQNAKLQPDEMVVTGQGEVYPSGIPIGRVREIDRKDNALYQTAVLEPAVDFSSLVHVLVLKSP